jgi:LacI family transcriptional regulator
MKPKLKDIANNAGVSISTVSRVLNQDSRISYKTSIKVLEEVRKLQNLHQPQSASKRIFMLLVANPVRSIEDDAFFSRVLDGILSGSTRYGMHCIVRVVKSDEPFDSATIPLELLNGFILAGVNMPDKVIEFVQNTGITTVQIGRHKGYENCSSVNNDNARGGYLAAQVVAELGYRKILILSGALNIPTFSDRINSFKYALIEHGIYDDAIITLESDGYSETEGYELIKKELPSFRSAGNRANKKRELIFCVTDWLAKGAYQALRELGISVPSQIGVMGFGNLKFSEYLIPALSTISLNPFLLGKMSLLLLTEKNAGNIEDNEHIYIEPLPILRESTRNVTDDV